MGAIVGPIGLPFCAERIKALQLFKNPLEILGTSVNVVSALPAYLAGLDSKSLITAGSLAIGEEIFCRGLIQKGLLKEVPRKVLKTFFQVMKML